MVGWDGADWASAQALMEAGHLPALASLTQTGCAGPIRGFAPWLSPMLWTTLATGAHPDRHGLDGFAVFDEASGLAHLAGSRDRRVPALWNLLSNAGRSCAIFGWPGTFPAEELPGGLMVAESFAHAPDSHDEPWPVPLGAVAPAGRAEDLDELRLRPAEVDAALLGLFIPRLREIDPKLDRRPGWLLRQLAELYTIHNAAAVTCAEAQPDFLAVHFPFISAVEREFGIFQAPRHPAAGARDCELYGDVVSSAYRVQDALLADLIASCEPDTAVVVVSTHGLAHGDLRPIRRPRTAMEYLSWCRPQGLLAMRGPGVRNGGAIKNARIEDLAPTLLAWLGMPEENFISGRVLHEIFKNPQAATKISRSESAQVVLKAEAADDPELRDEDLRLLRRMARQGWLHPLAASTLEGGRMLVDENQYFLGIALLNVRRTTDALEPLHLAFLASPESPLRALNLIQCLFRLGLTDEIKTVAQSFLDYGENDSRHRLLNAAIHLTGKRFGVALAQLSGVTEGEFAENRRTLERIALTGLGRHAEAAISFQRSLEDFPDTAELWMGLGFAQLRSLQFSEAHTSALRAVALDGQLPEAGRLVEQADESLQRGRLPESLKPTGLNWGQLTEKAIERRGLRIALRERTESFRLERVKRRACGPTIWSVDKTAGAKASVERSGQVTICSAAGAIPSWSMRAPWPDEMFRIERYFSPALRNTGVDKSWIRVLTAGDEERLTGVAILTEVESESGERPGGRIDLDIRDEWVGNDAGNALLSAVVKDAEAVGLQSLTLQARTGKRLDALLQQHGFIEVIRHEVWETKLADAIERHQAEFGRIIKRWPVQVVPFEPGYLETARRICESTGLLAREKVMLRSAEHPKGIEPAISFLAGPPDQPVALVLGSVTGARATIEVMARNPAVPVTSLAAVHALFLQFFEAAEALGCMEVDCSIRPEITPTIIELMKLWNGHCSQSQAGYQREVVSCRVVAAGV
ncbi:MAG: alkaline phosphatase family protein [Rariglobus sp.]